MSSYSSEERRSPLLPTAQPVPRPAGPEPAVDVRLGRSSGMLDAPRQRASRVVRRPLEACTATRLMLFDEAPMLSWR